MSGSYYMTEEGFKKIKAELAELINVERIKISRQIAEARDKGDLSENAEYDAAKEAQGLLELRISRLETKMRNAKIIKPEQIDDSKVQILTRVSLKNLKTNATVVYSIVPDGEADFKENKISILTPIAKGLLGKAKGDVVDVIVPAGTLNFEILDITRIE
ncbi:MAG: transcription elongation factor GreA [Salinivirgaceae bacterium]|nr:transcription elongation factor GreA [Salinivirgaceae bacterium]MDD4745839.1 transcription elongation factor GreA [Salinivirgaceae bacterium]MDY0280241.1 transcription elongation factor GreA [Salinivirgaceae bacterium]